MSTEKKADAPIYTTSYHELKIDSLLYDVVYANGYFFILQADQKIAVLDTFFRRQPQIEDSINKFLTAGIYTSHDSVIFCKFDQNRTGSPGNLLSYEQL